MLWNSGHAVRPRRLANSFQLALIAIFFLGYVPACADDDLAQLSYYRGYILWKEQLESPGIPCQLEQVIAGMRAAATGQGPVIEDPEQLTAMVRKLQTTILAKQLVDNLANADRFLADLANDTDAIELRKGHLYFKRVKEGGGPKVKADSAPILVFSSHILELKEVQDFITVSTPTRISLPTTIRGFAEGVVGMRVGEQRRLYIHPDMAYGKDGGLVGPNRLLIFDVEVSSINEF